MNKEKAKELRKIIEQPEKRTKEEAFIELINGCQIKIDKVKYPDSVFFFKNGEYYFEIGKDNLWCRYKYVWSVFESEFKLNHHEIKNFIEDMVEEHFKINGVTPIRIEYGDNGWVYVKYRC